MNIHVSHFRWVMQDIDIDFPDNGAKKLDKLSAFFWLENFAKMNLVLRIWSHILKKSIIENFIFSAVPTNTPRGFHVETIPRRFNVESTWCVCRGVARIK